jgi:hypothetical protein
MPEHKEIFVFLEEKKRMPKTYNSRDSPMVTHLTTNPPVSCLNIAEQTGCVVLKILWSYVKVNCCVGLYIPARGACINAKALNIVPPSGLAMQIDETIKLKRKPGLNIHTHR